MSLFDNLISKYVKREEFLLQDMPRGSGVKAMKVKPFITISREAGSGGKPVAKLVAKKLRYKLHDKEIIEEVAKKSKKRKNLIKSLDEKERGFMNDLVHSLLNPDYVPESTYFKNLCKVILAMARKGNCVILGRGGNFVTSQYGGLHVRIVAPYLVRAGFAAQYEGRTIYEARERMKKFDRERKQFIRQFFNKNPSNANYYDLVINTTYIGVEEAANIIVCAFKVKFPDWRQYK